MVTTVTGHNGVDGNGTSTRKTILPREKENVISQPQLTEAAIVWDRTLSLDIVESGATKNNTNSAVVPLSVISVINKIHFKS